ncbi:MAG TPA: energy-coupling factor transporter ATPase [Limnochordales bacterium]
MSIRVQHLSYRYPTALPSDPPALVDVSFTIEEGEFVALLGPTGSGKSTLVQHLNGLLRPPPGTVWVFGMDVGRRGTDLSQVRRRVGLVFQYPEYQLFEETVLQDVAFGPRNLGVQEQEALERARRALRRVGLDPDVYGNRSPFELSGGQRRRAALAGVLALESPVLVLDEPTAGLDPRGRQELMELLRELNREGTTVVLVTHSMEEVARVARRALLLSRGRLVADCPVDSLFYDHGDLVRSVGLRVPETVELVQALRRRGAPIQGKPLTPQQAAAAIARWRLGEGPADRTGSRARPGSGQGRQALGRHALRSRPVRPR